jgi:hypothetical protein
MCVKCIFGITNVNIIGSDANSNRKVGTGPTDCIKYHCFSTQKNWASKFSKIRQWRFQPFGIRWHVLFFNCYQCVGAALSNKSLPCYPGKGASGLQWNFVTYASLHSIISKSTWILLNNSLPTAQFTKIKDFRAVVPSILVDINVCRNVTYPSTE